MMVSPAQKGTVAVRVRKVTELVWGLAPRRISVTLTKLGGRPYRDLRKGVPHKAAAGRGD